MNRNFGGIIWTNHALNRMRERGIKQGDAWATWRNPQQSRKGIATGTWVYYRDYGREQIEVVAKQNDQREWIILSVWSRPVFIKEKSAQKLSFWQALVKILFPR